MFQLHNWYPFFIVLGVVLGLIIWALYFRGGSSSASDLDGQDRAVFTGISILIILLITLCYGGIVSSFENGKKAERINKREVEACRDFKDVKERILCIQNLP